MKEALSQWEIDWFFFPALSGHMHLDDTMYSPATCESRNDIES